MIEPSSLLSPALSGGLHRWGSRVERGNKRLLEESFP